MIAVIGILATITLVSYTGVEVTSKSQSAKSAATTIQRKIEAYASINNTYPTVTTTAADYTSALNMYGDSALVGTNLYLGTIGSTNGSTTVEIAQCTATPGTAYRLRYWDFAKNAPSTNIIYGQIGAQSCSGWTVLN